MDIIVTKSLKAYELQEIRDLLLHLEKVNSFLCIFLEDEEDLFVTFLPSKGQKVVTIL